MKRLLLTSFLFLLMFVPVNLVSQEDAMVESCNKMLKTPFVVTGQPLKAFLTGDEVAEFRATLYQGTVYRIVACSHDMRDIEFSVFDKDRNLLFASRDFVGADYWDFQMEGSIDCIIEARLNAQRTSSGIALVMMGFKSSIQ